MQEKDEKEDEQEWQAMEAMKMIRMTGDGIPPPGSVGPGRAEDRRLVLPR